MFQITPIPAAVVDAAKARLAAGDPTVQRRIITTPSSAPCRRCLRDGAPGETMLLFAHTPFDAPSPYAETGPIFAHEQCEGASLAAGELPPVTMARAQAFVRAYDHAGAIHGAVLAQRENMPDVIARFFADSDVAYAHVRSASFGCFTYRVDR